jgi:hypothetical protein
MTEAQAWRDVAKRIDAMTDERQDGFLCLTVKSLSDAYDDLVARMLRRIDEQMRGTFSSIAYNYCDEIKCPGGRIASAEEGRKARVLAALWLALEAESES